MEVNYSIGKILLLTYVIIASGYCNTLISKEMKDTIENNKVVQHLILLVLIMVLMSLFGNSLKLDFVGNETLNLIIISCLVYIWFILTTKLSVTWNFGMLILLSIYFLYENNRADEYKKQLGDSKLKESTKESLINSFVSDNKMLLLALFGTTLIGTLLYANDKVSVQTGGGSKFNKIINFLIE
jgi:hypothetical protein